MRTGTCIALIVVGAILTFAISAGSSHGLKVHAVGVILMLAGLLGLVLSLVVWGPLNPAARRRRSRLTGYDDGALPVVEERRVYQEQSPAAEESPVYEDQAPVVEERRIYRDQPPL
jgi:hypothetical protein